MEIDNVGSLEILINKLSDAYCTDIDFSKSCIQIAQGISNGQFTIVNLTEQLGDLLVNVSPEKRALGTSILSQVLEAIPKDALMSEQLQFICTFYADRLKDNHQVIPAALRGILALVQLNSFPDNAATQLLSAIFQHIPCQQQQYPDRCNIYMIFQKLLDFKEFELKQMKLDFVFGVISAVDGERDPRNLLLLFEWLPKFLKSVNLGHLNEEMFEVMACYFPVDFRAPSTDTSVISREQLAEALCPCLCALPTFGQFCLPLALEKLDSSLVAAKLDSLELLKQGCKVFNVFDYIQHSTEIWSLIYKELLNSTDLSIISACFDTLPAFISKLSHGDERFFKDFLKNITDTTKGNLLPDSRLFEASARILIHVAKASKPSASFIVEEIMPIISNTYSITKTPAHRLKLYKALVSFFKAYVDVNPGENITKIQELREIPTICADTLCSGDLELQIAGVNSLALITNSLPNVIREFVYGKLKVLLLKPEENRLREALLLFFKALAIQYPEEVQKNVINEMTPNDLMSLYLYLDALGYIACLRQFYDSILPILTSHCLKNTQEADVALSCLKTILNKNECDDFIVSYLIEKLDVIHNVTSWVFDNLQTIDVDQNQKLLENISSIFMSLIGDLSETKQNEIVQPEVERILRLFKQTDNFVLIVLLNGLLVRIRNIVALDNIIVENLLTISLKPCDIPFVPGMSVQFLANILNKTSDDDNLRRYLNTISGSCTETLSNRPDNVSNVASVISWVSKALWMRGDPDACIWVDKMFELLEKSEETAMHFKILMSEDCDTLDLKSHCKIQVLYRQKLFHQLTKKLGESATSVNHLTAFGFLVQQTPYQIFQLEIKKILRLLLLCLDTCTNSEVLYSVLEKVLKWIQSGDKFVEEVVSQFLPRLLKLSRFKRSMNVRIVALDCIHGYTLTCPTHVLLPHKMDAVIQLAECLDDHKRLVRKKAVEARSSWFLIDAPL